MVSSGRTPERLAPPRPRREPSGRQRRRRESPGREEPSTSPQNLPPQASHTEPESTRTLTCCRVFLRGSRDSGTSFLSFGRRHSNHGGGVLADSPKKSVSTRGPQPKLFCNVFVQTGGVPSPPTELELFKSQHLPERYRPTICPSTHLSSKTTFRGRVWCQAIKLLLAK